MTYTDFGERAIYRTAGRRSLPMRRLRSARRTPSIEIVRECVFRDAIVFFGILFSTAVAWGRQREVGRMGSYEVGTAARVSMRASVRG